MSVAYSGKPSHIDVKTEDTDKIEMHSCQDILL